MQVSEQDLTALVDGVFRVRQAFDGTLVLSDVVAGVTRPVAELDRVLQRLAPQQFADRHNKYEAWFWRGGEGDDNRPPRAGWVERWLWWRAERRRLAVLHGRLHCPLIRPAQRHRRRVPRPR